MKFLALGLSYVLSAAAICSAQSPVYLSCDIASPAGEARHFEFTLNEIAGTVVTHDTKFNEVTTAKASFEANAVTWTTNEKYLSYNRSVNRSTLEITEIATSASIRNVDKGVCKLITPEPTRKF